MAGPENHGTVLVVAAHPDDEVLGVGGGVARHVAVGDRVEILILAEGATSRRSEDADGVAALRGAAEKAARALGACPPRFAGLPDNRLDGVDLLDVVKVVEAVVEDIAPTIVYTHHPGDLNVDHRVAAQAVLTACRPLPGSTVAEIHAFETVSSTEWSLPGQAFTPTEYVDIEPWLDAKMAALAAYGDTEMRPAPHPRSIEAVQALATARGAQVGLRAAEAFALLRRVVT